MANSLRSNVAWISDAEPLLACQRCDFGRDLLGENEAGRMCHHPEVGRRKPTESARGRHGSCGPDAKFLTMKGVAI